MVYLILTIEKSHYLDIEESLMEAEEQEQREITLYLTGFCIEDKPKSPLVIVLVNTKAKEPMIESLNLVT